MSRLGILEKGGYNRLRSFGEFYDLYYGDGTINRKPLAFEFEVPVITEDVYHPSILNIHNSGEFESITASHSGTDYTHQVLTETSFAQVDPLTTGEGFTIRSWKNLNGAPSKAGSLYQTPAASAVLAEVTFQKPPSATNDHELYLFFTENFGVASSYKCVEHHVFDPIADTLIVTTYAQHNVGQVNQIIKRETLDYTRVPGGKIWDYSLTRVVEEAANDRTGAIGTLRVIEKTKETYEDFSLSADGGEFGMRRMTERVRDFGTAPTSENLTTTYGYYDLPSNNLLHGRAQSIVNPDGSWTYYEIVDSLQNSSPQTTVFRSYLDVSMENREQAHKTITEYQAGTVTRTTTLGGVQTAMGQYSTTTDPNGNVTVTEKKWTGTEWAAEATHFHKHEGTGLEAGRRAWREHADGTATRWTYSGTHDMLIVTQESGAGDRSAITAGIKTVTNYNAAYQPIDVQVYDIEVGRTGGDEILISSRTTIGVTGGAIDPQGRHTKWKHFDGTDEYFTVNQHGCCGPEMTINRSGQKTLYFRDALRRVYKTTTQRSSNGPVVTATTVTNGLTTTQERTAGGVTIFTGETTRSLSGLSTTRRSPDADGDTTPEVSTSVTNLLAPGGPTTITTYPDTTTTRSVSFIDGRMKKSIDQESNETTYSYGTHNEQGGGEIRTVNLPGSSEQSTSYTDQIGRTFKMVYADGAETIQRYYAFDSSVSAGSRGKLESITDPDQVTITCAYNDEGEKTTTTTPLPAGENGVVQNRITFSETNVVATATVKGTTIAPAFETTSSVNDIVTSQSYRSIDGRTSGSISFGRESLATSTVPADGAWTATSTSMEGVQSRSFYDDGLMVGSVSFESGATLSATVPADITAVTEAGFITGQTMIHDAFGRALSQTDSRTGTMTYDAAADGSPDVTDSGNVLYVKDSGNRVTQFTYDNMGRRLTVDAPDSVNPAGGMFANITSTSYTDRSQVRATWGDQTYPRFYEYDAQRRMTHLHTYQTVPVVTQSTTTAPAGSAVTQWVYHDQRGWLTEKNHAGEMGNGPGEAADYTYTLAGRLATRTWERGVTTTYGYDQGLLVAVDYSDSTPDLGYGYDDFGRIHAVIRAGLAHASYTFDPANLVLTSESLNQDTLAKTLTRNYDHLLRPLSLALGSEHSTGYGYDGAGRFDRAWHKPTLITGVPQGPADFSYGYTPESYGLVKTVTGPAHTVTNGYELTRNVLLNKRNEVDTLPSSNFAYTTNDIGQRTNLTTSGSAFATAPVYTWSYNARGEMVGADDTSTADNDRAYQYDGIGNRLKSADSLILPTENNYVANALNQYTTVPGVAASPSYDADGNAEAYPVPVDLTANATLTWDAENRLSSVTVGSAVTTYTYDYLSRRISKSSAGVTTHYLYDGWNLIAEYTGTVLEKTYTWGMDLSGSMQGAGGVGGLLAVDDQVDTYYPTYDGNGNVSEYLNAAGAVQAHYEYDAFGNTTVSTGSKKDDFLHRFSTKPLDAETGLYYYGYRYYDPVTGRWPSRDPIGERGGKNLYGMVGNAIINRWDYLGLKIQHSISGCNITIKINITIFVPRKYRKWDMSDEDPSNWTWQWEPISPDQKDEVDLDKIAKEFEEGINNAWNDGDNCCGCCAVEFEATVSADKNSRDFSQIDDDNEIQIIPDPEHRSWVRGVGDRTGAWGTNAGGWVAAHEAGHLMGLDDLYTESGGAMAGHEGSIMASYGGKVRLQDKCGVLTANNIKCPDHCNNNPDSPCVNDAD